MNPLSWVTKHLQNRLHLPNSAFFWRQLPCLYNFLFFLIWSHCSFESASPVLVSHNSSFSLDVTVCSLLLPRPTVPLSVPKGSTSYWRRVWLLLMGPYTFLLLNFSWVFTAVWSSVQFSIGSLWTECCPLKSLRLWFGDTAPKVSSHLFLSVCLSLSSTPYTELVPKVLFKGLFFLPQVDFIHSLNWTSPLKKLFKSIISSHHLVPKLKTWISKCLNNLFT